MKSSIKITILALVLVSFASCKKDSRPNYEYMPNMYESVAYEAYQESDAFANGIEAQLPADGTIPRGYTPFDIANTNEGYEIAKTSLLNKLDSTQIDQNLGKELFGIYCAICHGNNGKGEGKLYEKGIIPGSYADKDITIGSIYHTIYYGKNSMGSYANQLSENERWQVAEYVLTLKGKLKK